MGSFHPLGGGGDEMEMENFVGARDGVKNLVGDHPFKNPGQDVGEGGLCGV